MIDSNKPRALFADRPRPGARAGGVYGLRRAASGRHGVWRGGGGPQLRCLDGWLKSQRARVPVVSVGNLTLGGTGKTPMVEWLARWFRGHQVRVAILSRGYGHTGGMNDEGRVLEENLPDVPHLQDPDRVALAEAAVLELETELIVLDDGFQHRRLARDLDVVLLDALEPFGLSQMFPRGLLQRADSINEALPKWLSFRGPT